LIISRVEHQQRENKQHQEERHVEVQHHVEVQQNHHVMDEGDGQKSNHAHPKLDIKNFHTQLW